MGALQNATNGFWLDFNWTTDNLPVVSGSYLSIAVIGTRAPLFTPPGCRVFELLSEKDPAPIPMSVREKTKRLRDLTATELAALDF